MVQTFRDRAGATWRCQQAAYALDSAARVALEFEADETLVLHHVRVQRAGVTTDRLVLSDVRLAQREHRLEQQIYDGRQTAILFVPDLRVGDVLDYAYTLQSRSARPGEKYVRFSKRSNATFVR